MCRNLRSGRSAIGNPWKSTDQNGCRGVYNRPATASPNVCVRNDAQPFPPPPDDIISRNIITDSLCCISCIPNYSLRQRYATCYLWPYDSMVCACIRGNRNMQKLVFFFAFFICITFG